MTRVSVAASLAAEGGTPLIARFPFFKDGKPIEGAHAPAWGMTLRAAGKMRFRWGEANENREKLAALFPGKRIVPIELVHSKAVVAAERPGDTDGVQADGIITRSSALVPSVTVADCAPIFLHDARTGAFGIFHSGWKGTGIAAEGIRLMAERYGSNPRDISAAIGPHIGACCYAVDESRAAYFREAFTPKSAVSRTEGGKARFFLSLAEANRAVLRDAGVPDGNIVAATDCTCCAKGADGQFVFGSFRREAAFREDLSGEEKSRAMTVQAAFVVGARGA